MKSASLINWSAGENVTANQFLIFIILVQFALSCLLSNTLKPVANSEVCVPEFVAISCPAEQRSQIQACQCNPMSVAMKQGLQLMKLPPGQGR